MPILRRRLNIPLLADPQRTLIRRGRVFVVLVIDHQLAIVFVFKLVIASTRAIEHRLPAQAAAEFPVAGGRDSMVVVTLRNVDDISIGMGSAAR